MKKLQNLQGAKALNKKEQQNINGGAFPKATCSGTGTGGVTSLGHSSACIGQDSGTECTINGYLAECTGNGDGFWFY